ncbi:hypothetical protein H6P81_006848 [Aristolochia fimbriata]|uniref:Uncharacterized protein n=1 Tax=Aristolochia fimbriata TaxID=158543 RepID=A0AAV7EZB6_ARIFI|nr:hypothetical protein H6P81_006848 [Aristolochia fimbriata]
MWIESTDKRDATVVAPAAEAAEAEQVKRGEERGPIVDSFSLLLDLRRDQSGIVIAGSSFGVFSADRIEEEETLICFLETTRREPLCELRVGLGKKDALE